jgi:hypothetical protein
MTTSIDQGGTNAERNLDAQDSGVRRRRPRLVLGTGGALHWQDGRARTRVRAVRCFPWSDPQHFVALYDDEGREVALIEDPASLDPASRRCLFRALGVAGFVFEVESILAIEDEIELRAWRVVTRQGERSFQTALDAWPRPLPGGGYLVEDVAGDAFVFPETRQLHPKSAELLAPLVD